MKPRDMGLLLDECAEAGVPTRVHLDRPFDVAPDGTEVLEYGVAELAELVREMAGWLAAAGVGRGDRVAIVKDSHWDYDLLACAAVRVGAVPAQLSGRLAPDVLDVLLARLAPAVLVTSTPYLAGLAFVAPRVIVLDGRVPGAIDVADLRGSRAPAPVRRGDDEPLVINHTSGTTGVPKLVVHSAGTIIGRLARFEAVRYPLIGVRRDDVLANASDFAHGRTFCWTASALCLRPREIVIVSRHDADHADPVLRAHPPTIVEGLPATYVRFRELTERLHNPFRRVRLFVSTYDAMHPPVMRAYLHATAHRRPLWMEGWGQTETGPLSFRFRTRSSLVGHASSRNLGYPVPVRTRLRVVDPDTFDPLPRGHPGLVLARTRARCLDYVGESRRWRDKCAGEWWNTGDIGVHHRDGSVELLDREVDRVPGRSCLRTEDVVEDLLPEVVECVLLGRPAGPPLPVVVTADGTLDPVRWRTVVPDLPDPVVLTWDEVPRTGTGKVRRSALLRQLTGTVATSGSGRWT
ncbi:class I adenylate-forming enzyme family protein [Actinophytocola sp.]|uniref:class I adenylate-forming enzyme family protein n=1 Tax=Actinophytocola sp. TaxID=1872138 RepID=UPI00389AD286